MNPYDLALVAALDRIVELLRLHGEQHWSANVERDAHLIRQGDVNGRDHFLSLFGGMGSFSDIFLSPENGAQITPQQVAPVNRELHRLQSEAYQQARASERASR